MSTSNGNTGGRLAVVVLIIAFILAGLYCTKKYYLDPAVNKAAAIAARAARMDAEREAGIALLDAKKKADAEKQAALEEASKKAEADKKAAVDKVEAEKKVALLEASLKKAKAEKAQVKKSSKKRHGHRNAKKGRASEDDLTVDDSSTASNASVSDASASSDNTPTVNVKNKVRVIYKYKTNGINARIIEDEEKGRFFETLWRVKETSKVYHGKASDAGTVPLRVGMKFGGLSNLGPAIAPFKITDKYQGYVRLLFPMYKNRFKNGKGKVVINASINGKKNDTSWLIYPDESSAVYASPNKNHPGGYVRIIAFELGWDTIGSAAELIRAEGFIPVGEIDPEAVGGYKDASVANGLLPAPDAKTE